MALSLDRYPGITYDAELPVVADLEELRQLRKWEAAIGYRIFAAMRWGQMGDGHISARRPGTDRPLLGAGLRHPFRRRHDGQPHPGRSRRARRGWPHRQRDQLRGLPHPLAHPERAPRFAAAAHVHTPFGTPWAANVEPFRPINQESCALVFDQSIYEGDDLEVFSTDGGEAIARALGDTRVCIMANHGLLTGGRSPGDAVGMFVTAERVAEVHVKAPEARSISEEAAKEVDASLNSADMGWRVFQWLARDLVPDPSVVLG